MEKPLCLCKAATSVPTKPPFIFIIDEINRANLAAVFGALLYCLEYRGKQVPQPTAHEMQSFTTPEKVYLIGTMNNLDKGVGTFDFALRRRFAFFVIGSILAA